MSDISLTKTGLVSVSPAVFHTLRDRVGPQALQEAGYAAGEGTYKACCSWLPEHAGVNEPGELAAPHLAEVLSQFFSSLGWGTAEVSPVGEPALAFDSSDWAEAQP